MCNKETDFMYSEVDELLHYLPKSYMSKIPDEIVSHIHLHKNINYQTKIDSSIKQFEDIHFSNDALSLIAYLNLEYWLDEKTKQELEQDYGICQREEVALKLFISHFNKHIH